MISRQTIEEVKKRASILAVVQEISPIKRMGARSFALCPFHQEKSPSFLVKEEDNSFHCFGCGASGNVISFVMKHRGKSFPEAVEDLAARFGIEVQNEEGKPQGGAGPDKRKLYAVNALAQNLFTTALLGDSEAKRYLEGRGLTPEVIKLYGLGLAPRGRDALLRVLRARKVPENFPLSLGLIRKGSSGEAYDLFSARLMVPIWVDTRRIAGFGGRIIPAMWSEEALTRAPKYLNSPESPIYYKSKVLFGLPQALSAIRATGEVYVVEGYLDVISLAQHGVRNVVATCGTALTPQHVDQLSRLAKRVVVLFDGDKAGRAAAAKSFNVFISAKVDAWAVMLDPEDDPDTFAQRNKGETARQLAGLKRQELFDIFLDAQLDGLGVQSAALLGINSRVQMVSEVARILAAVDNQLLLLEYGRRLAGKLMLEEREVLRALEAARGVKERGINQRGVNQPVVNGRGVNGRGAGSTAAPLGNALRGSPEAHGAQIAGAVSSGGSASLGSASLGGASLGGASLVGSSPGGEASYLAGQDIRKPNMEGGTSPPAQPVEAAGRGSVNAVATQLPRVEQELMMCAVMRRRSVPVELLNDSELISLLSPTSLSFLEALAELVAEEGRLASEELRKEAIRSMLGGFGKSWLALWKKAHEVYAGRPEQQELGFIQCCRALRKSKLERLRAEIAVEARQENDLERKLELGQRQIALERELKSLG